MNAKHFVVEVKYDPAATCFICGDQSLCEVLYHLINTGTACQTNGPRPAVMVMLFASESEPFQNTGQVPYIAFGDIEPK